MGLLDAANPDDLRYLLLPFLPPLYAAARAVAQRLLAATPFGSETGLTLLAFGLTGVAAIGASRLLPWLSRFLVQQKLRHMRGQIRGLRDEPQKTGAASEMRTLLQEVTRSRGPLYARGPYGASSCSMTTRRPAPASRSS
jgi:hypothetical protein